MPGLVRRGLCQEALEERLVSRGLGVGRVGGHHKEESSQRDEPEKGIYVAS